MHFGKRILSLAMAFALTSAPLHAGASEVQHHTDYNKAMLSLTPQADNSLYLSNLADAETAFLNLNGYEESSAMVIYARGMTNLFSGKFADAVQCFEQIVDSADVIAELTEWELPLVEELLTYAQAATIEVTDGYLNTAAELYSQIPNLFDAQGRMAIVTERMKENGHPKTISVTPEGLDLFVGDQATLSTQYAPAGAYIGDLVWFSSDESVATIDQNGIVTAVGAGNASVGYGSGADSKVKGLCEVTVTAVNATSLSIPQNQISLLPGESLALPIDVAPADALLNWNSTDPSIVTVENGVVHAVREGFTNVVVSSGTLMGVYNITVVPPYQSIDNYYGGYLVNRSSAYVNKTTTRSVEARCAIDGDTTTAWNTNGRWNGEWISLTVQDGQKYSVSSFTIYNGYQRKSSTYYSNTRIKDLDVYCDGNYVTTLTLSDSWGAQEHFLPEPMIGSEFKFVITSVYYGNDFSDCALSELLLHG